MYSIHNGGLTFQGSDPGMVVGSAVCLAMGQSGLWMVMESVQTVIHRQQSTKEVSENIRTAMADIQLNVEAVTPQKYPPQLRAISSLIQM
jgi:hypothetical protein